MKLNVWGLNNKEMFWAALKKKSANVAKMKSQCPHK